MKYFYKTHLTNSGSNLCRVHFQSIGKKFYTVIVCILQLFREIKVKDFYGDQLEQKQVFYTSKDGTKIPMFIVHRKVCAFLGGINSIFTVLYYLIYHKFLYIGHIPV